MRVVIAADHGAVEMKAEIAAFLAQKGIEVTDLGTDDAQTSVDYAFYAKQAGEAVANGDYEFGILCCGTGIGMSMAANKIKGIRAACTTDYFGAKMTRLHNDANVLCLGARILGIGAALELVDVFVSTPFSGEERHERRIGQIRELENS